MGGTCVVCDVTGVAVVVMEVNPFSVNVSVSMLRWIVSSHQNSLTDHTEVAEEQHHTLHSSRAEQSGVTKWGREMKKCVHIMKHTYKHLYIWFILFVEVAQWKTIFLYIWWVYLICLSHKFSLPSTLILLPFPLLFSLSFSVLFSLWPFRYVLQQCWPFLFLFFYHG